MEIQNQLPEQQLNNKQKLKESLKRTYQMFGENNEVFLSKVPAYIFWSGCVIIPFAWIFLRWLVFPEYTFWVNFQTIFGSLQDKDIATGVGEINKIPKTYTSLFLTSVFLFDFIIPIVAGIIAWVMSGTKVFSQSGAMWIYTFTSSSILIAIIVPSSASEYIWNLAKVLGVIGFYWTSKSLRNSLIKFIKLNLVKFLVILAVVVGGMAMILVENVIINTIYSFTLGTNTSSNQASLEDTANSNNAGKILWMGITVILIAPISEELLVRRSLYGSGRNRIFGMIMSSLYFAQMHIASSGDLEFIFNYFVITIPIMVAVAMFDNIHFGIAIHMASNALAFILLTA